MEVEPEFQNRNAGNPFGQDQQYVFGMKRTDSRDSDFQLLAFHPVDPLHPVQKSSLISLFKQSQSEIMLRSVFCQKLSCQSKNLISQKNNAPENSFFTAPRERLPPDLAPYRPERRERFDRHPRFCSMRILGQRREWDRESGLLRELRSFPKRCAPD